MVQNFNQDNFSLSLTKILPPKWNSKILRRDRLSERLYDSLDNKLTVISASPGYGKTTLLVDWIQQVDLPICWLSLDELDQDFTRFLPHFIAALGRIFTTFSQQVNANLEGINLSQIEAHRLATMVTNLAYQHIQEQVIFIIDDYHLVDENPQINEFIDNFLRYADENIHLIIASRQLLSLPDLTTMVARRQVSGMGSEDLAFEADEIQAILLKNYQVTISDDRAEQLAIETEGWITSLLLSAETMWDGMEERIQKAKTTGVGLYNYMAKQVLQEQPDHIREFLLLTSYFDEFDANLCHEVLDALPGIPHQEWRKLIHELLQRNTFIHTFEDTNTFIRYHRLFREFLQATIQQENPELVSELRAQLARVYTIKKEWEKAFYTNLQLNNNQLLIEFIKQAWSPLFRKGRYQTLQGWLNQVPRNLLEQHPELFSILGIIEINFGKVESGVELLTSAIANINGADNPIIKARALSWRAWGYNHLGDHQQSIQETEKILEIAEINDLPEIRAEALRLQSENLKWMGKIQESIERLQDTLEIHQSLGDQYNMSIIYLDLGILLKNIGLTGEAEEYYTKALQYWRETHSSNNLAIVLNNLGVLHHTQGDFLRAIVFLDEGLENARLSGNNNLEALNLTSIGDLYMDLDAQNAAEDVYVVSKTILQQIDNPSLSIYIDAALAAIARQRNTPLEAQKYVAEIHDAANGANTHEAWGSYYREVGLTMSQQGDHESALKALDKAQERFDLIGNRISLVKVGLSKGKIQFNLGQKKEAFDELKHILPVVDEIGYQQQIITAGRDALSLLQEFNGYPELKSTVTEFIEHINHFDAELPTIRRKLRKQSPTIKFSPPKLEFFALGKAEVKVGNQLLTNADWQSIKARDLLFFLLAFPEGMTKEQIGLYFWPDYSPNQLKVIFKKTIYRLRRATENEIILFDNERYRFNTGLDYDYDVTNFWGYLHEARQSEDRYIKSEKLSRAVDIYKGAYLPEIENTWVIGERERLWKAFSTAGLDLAQYHLEKNHFNDVLELTKSILGHDPTSEPAHRLAMRAHAGLGDRAGVIHQYELCQKSLLEELAATPSIQTIELYQFLTT